MLEMLDVLIGVSFLILVASMAVMVIVDAVATLLLLRSRKLSEGLQDLLTLLDGGLCANQRAEITREILLHPTIRSRSGPSALIFGGWRGEAIHRHEFTRILLALGSSNGPGNLLKTTRDALSASLTANGVTSPDTALAAIRRKSAELEAASPDMPVHRRQDTAILSAASSDFVFKINDWFDQVIDRVTSRYTQTARLITFVVSLALASLVQFDVIRAINILSMNESARKEFSSAAAAVVDKAEAQAGKPSQNGAEPKNQISTAVLPATNISALFTKHGILVWPTWDTWGHWTASTTFLGVLLSALLMSLGAPFWYATLKNLLDLRSRVSQKDDQQRLDRQLQTESPNRTGSNITASGSTTSVPSLPPPTGTVRFGPKRPRV